MKTFNINGKTLTVGEDVFTGKDISRLGDEYLDYKIAVMQWFKDGGKVEHSITDVDNFEVILTPHWNWVMRVYRAVPKPKELSPEEKLQKWIAETGAKVGDKVKDLDGDVGVIDEINDTTIWVNLSHSGILCACVPDELELIKPTYEERQADWVKANDLKVGNTVKFFKGFEDYENGFFTMKGDTDEVMSKSGIVCGITSKCIEVEFPADTINARLIFHIPYFCLEKVAEPEYRAYTFEEFCMMQMLGKAVKRKDNGEIGYIFNYFIFTKYIKILFKECYCDYTPEQFKDEFTWIDGSTCGVEL